MKCTFRPYEGKDKFIFISYSHSDSEIIAPILEQLNQSGFRIWYDEGIEWGSEWPESIASHLRECEVCMAFHSKLSVVSPNCRQEITYAFKMKKNILSVYLEEVELSDGMDMQLTSFQSTFPYQYKDMEEFYIKLINTKILQCCKKMVGEANIQVESTRSIAQHIQHKKYSDIANKENIFSYDKEIAAKFDELFSTPRKASETSLLIKRISEVKNRNFVDSLEESIKNIENEEQSDYSYDSISLIPIEQRYRTLYYESAIWEGKSFVLPDIPGLKTLVFQLVRNIDYKTLTKYYTYELLDSSQQSLEDKMVDVTTYYVDFPQKNKDELLFLHFSNEGVFVNIGISEGNKVSISKEPRFLAFSETNQNSQLNLCSVAYDLSNLSEEERYQIEWGDNNSDEMMWCKTDIDEKATVVIDPETALPVKRKVYFDEDEKKWKAKIKIKRNKPYFTFQVRFEVDSSSTSIAVQSLSNLEIARFYKRGIYGFPKDIIQAVNYFEKDGSAQALYEIADLFRTEKEIHDKESYMQYLKLAVEKGCVQAIIEYALYLYFSSNEIYRDKVIMLLQSIESETGLREFIYGYLIEQGYLQGEIDDVYEYYVKSAISGYEPACARLGRRNISIDTLELKSNFIRNLYHRKNLLNYCMGCILYYGLDILPIKEKGIRFLEESAKAGNKLAIESLFNIYDTDEEYMNSSCALECLKILAHDDETLSNELANRLWNGLGCDVNAENDRIAFETLCKMAKPDNKKILHSLGWAYKTGRGCEIDYDMAKKLFVKARKAESYFHLGDMYERGLGVQVDFDKAIKYYRKGVRKGCKEAGKRLKELDKEQ